MSTDFIVNGAPIGMLTAQTIATQFVAFHTDQNTDPVLTNDDIVYLVRSNRCANVNGAAVTVITDPGWIPQYDLVQAVIDGWLKKASKASGSYGMSDNGISLQRQQVQEQCLAMAKEWKKKLLGTIQIASPSLEQGMADFSA